MYMIIRRLTLFLVCVGLLSTVAGCASIDRIMVSKFEPVRTEANAQFFKFTAIADAMYPLKSEEAERMRINWLETWLRDNGYSSNKYEIISRIPILRNKGLLGDIYDIFYEVKVVE